MIQATLLTFCIINFFITKHSAFFDQLSPQNRQELHCLWTNIKTTENHNTWSYELTLWYIRKDMKYKSDSKFESFYVFTK